ncbi:hypothetical protein A8C32_06415 [Flavivirga aquatica]|uniref:Sialate O-acetylesterase domain-containing protein n=1 Tax=Flavivirga aquatica TaxID=1849968 RepID=A0A1E5SI56_9FLAO|nr:sialate O-acetylesterase [Flavivirga aquatica]OEJ98817.1 hypothetical protein A8C32_06415 [Flavivirga aquatica]
MKRITPYLAILLLVLVVTICFGYSKSFKTCTIKKNTVQVVLLAGQSNMAGGGNYDDLDDSIKERIAKVSNRVQVSINRKPAKPLSYSDNKPSEKYNFTKRFGPELFIGLILAEKNPKQEFLLIKTSQGGTSLYGAWNPNWSAKKAKTLEKGEKKQNMKLYEKHINQIRKELSKLKDQGKSYKIIGLAWMQGENDASREISARSYKENLKTLIESYRKAFKVKKMPVVVGQINSKYGNFPEGPDMVRKAYVDVANADNFVDVIKTTTDRTWNDYPKHTDNVHYNTEGQKRLGITFGEKLMALQKK